jgi:uncharacterized membrane protein YoaK (UPF0700 family)
MYTRKDATLGPVPTLLAFVSGLVGTLSFVGLFGLFAAARSFLAKRARLHRLVAMLISFVAGTILGTLGYLTVGFWSLLLPIIIITGLSASVRPHTAPV